jgi:hypothetical protein
MANRTFISFDWAIKKILRHKENFVSKWFYFLKNSEIKEGFKAKGMERAKSVLWYETMAQDDKQAYKRHIENRRIENAVIETAEDKAARRKSIEIAKNALSIGANIDFVVNITGLKMHEVVLLSEGKDLDVENDDV